MEKPKIIIIEGVIAAGKSHTLKNIAESTVLKIPEPVEKYRTFSHFNPLALIYQCPKENSACAQLFIIDCLEKTIVRSCIEFQIQEEKNVIITERFLTSVNIFTKTMMETGVISDFSAAYVKQKLDECLSRVSKLCQIEKIIFLDTEIDVCMNRWLARERREEMSFNEAQMRNYMEILRKNYLAFYRENFGSQLEIIKSNDMLCIKNSIEQVLREK